MRLLWDEVLEEPVIFQERFYDSLGAPDAAEQAINAMFIKRAKELGLILVRANEGQPNSIPYPNNLTSSYSRAPFEYVDTAKIGVTRGRYTIDAEHIEEVDLG